MNNFTKELPQNKTVIQSPETENYSKGSNDSTIKRQSYQWTTIDYNGKWTTIDYNGQQTTIDYNGQWTTMDNY